VVKSVDFSPDNKNLLAAGKFKKLKFFDLETLAPKLEIEGHTAGTSRRRDCSVGWQVQKFAHRMLYLSGQRDPTRTAAVAGVKSALHLPCGTKVVSGGEDKMLRVWDIKSAKEIKNFPVLKEVTSMELSYDCKVFACVSARLYTCVMLVDSRGLTGSW
jgi:WD40 repeat protein